MPLWKAYASLIGFETDHVFKRGGLKGIAAHPTVASAKITFACSAIILDQRWQIIVVAFLCLLPATSACLTSPSQYVE